MCGRPCFGASTQVRFLALGPRTPALPNPDFRFGNKSYPNQLNLYVWATVFWSLDSSSVFAPRAPGHQAQLFLHIYYNFFSLMLIWFQLFLFVICSYFRQNSTSTHLFNRFVQQSVYVNIYNTNTYPFLVKEFPFMICIKNNEAS